MRVDLVSLLALASRSGSFDASATFTHGGGGSATSEHRLAAEDPMHWEYMVSAKGRESRWSCDGHELRHVTEEREFRTPVPDWSVPDEPWYFSSWLAVVDTWLVEMVRPMDLLARVLITSIDGGSEHGAVRVVAEPLGNEPSPYSGFSVPDGRSLSLWLDVGLGCLTQVEVTSTDGVSSTHTLTLIDRAA